MNKITTSIVLVAVIAIAVVQVKTYMDESAEKEMVLSVEKQKAERLELERQAEVERKRISLLNAKLEPARTRAYRVTEHNDKFLKNIKYLKQLETSVFEIIKMSSAEITQKGAEEHIRKVKLLDEVIAERQEEILAAVFAAIQKEGDEYEPKEESQEELQAKVDFVLKQLDSIEEELTEIYGE